MTCQLSLLPPLLPLDLTVKIILSNNIFSLFFIQKTGTGLGGRVRSQLNIQMNKVDGVKQAEGLRDILLPIIWFQDGIDHITNQETVDKIKQRL